jgi:flagellar hook assembly protein FlgD
MRDHCTIACSPAPPGETHLKIYDITGRAVRTFTSRPSSPALLSFTWDGRDEQGRKVSSGVYFVRLGGARPAAAVKLLLVR